MLLSLPHIVGSNRAHSIQSDMSSNCAAADGTSFGGCGMCRLIKALVPNCDNFS